MNAALRLSSDFPREQCGVAVQWTRGRILDDFFPQTASQFRAWVNGQYAQTFALFSGETFCGFALVRRLNPHLAEIPAFLFDATVLNDDNRIVEGLSLLLETLIAAGCGKVVIDFLEEDKRWLEILGAIGAIEEAWRRNHARRGGKLAHVVQFGIHEDLFYLASGRFQAAQQQEVLTGAM